MRTWIDKKKRIKQQWGAIKEPAVIGALLLPGYCCDFLDAQYIRVLAEYYNEMVERYSRLGIELPKNRNLPNDKHKDMILRELDCLVIEFMHERVALDIQTKLLHR